MIIARLASAIRHQNWSQIITEILIVVIGIFLGLQVTQWNEGRAERVEENRYLIRLHSEVLEVEGRIIRRAENRLVLRQKLTELTNTLTGKITDII